MIPGCTQATLVTIPYILVYSCRLLRTLRLPALWVDMVAHALPLRAAAVSAFLARGRLRTTRVRTWFCGHVAHVLCARTVSFATLVHSFARFRMPVLLVATVVHAACAYALRTTLPARTRCRLRYFLTHAFL